MIASDTKTLAQASLFRRMRTRLGACIQKTWIQV